MNKRLTEHKEGVSYSEEYLTETNVFEIEDELTDYPHCRLPNHYFDLLLSRADSTGSLRLDSNQVERLIR